MIGVGFLAQITITEMSDKGRFAEGLKLNKHMFTSLQSLQHRPSLGYLLLRVPIGLGNKTSLPRSPALQ